MVCTASFAQSIELVDEIEAMAPQYRSVASGMYYAKPLGMMYYRSRDTGISGDGTYFPFIWSRYCTPCFEDFTYINMSVNPSATRWNYKETLGEEGTYLEGDAYGYITQSVDLGDSLSVLYLYNEAGTEYYNMAYKENYNSGTVGKGLHYIYGADRYDGFEWIGWIDNMLCRNSSTSNSRMYRYGPGTVNLTLSAYDAGYYGVSGHMHSVTKDWAMDYVEENFYAPASPLYVDCVYCAGATFGNPSDKTFQPLKNGAELTMEILDQSTEEVLATLKAMAGDWEATYYTTVINTQTGYSQDGWEGYLKFRPLVDGVETPFVIDRAVTVRLSGLFNDDVDVGIGGNPIEDCVIDDGLYCARMFFTDPDGEYEVLKNVYQSAVMSGYDAMSISLNAVMDKVQVAEEYSNVVISDGTGYLCIRTTLPWYDSNLAENYSFVDMPDWITGVEAEAYGEGKNSYRVKFLADANTGSERTATIYVQCKGYVDTAPITITQEAFDAVGISEIQAPEGTKTGSAYNLAGQQVNETTKGILIKEGKKFLNK